MLLDSEIIIKWHSSNRIHFENLGYIFTKYGDEFLIKTKELQKGSTKKVNILCDYCEEEIYTNLYHNYIGGRVNLEKDACKKCRKKKMEEISLKLYGVKNPMLSDTIKNKLKKTNLEKYGFENAMQNKKVREKQRDTVRERYGVDHYSQLDDYKEKVRKTSLERYGTESAFQNDEIRNKIKDSMNRKYGVDNYSQTKEYKEKYRKTNLERYGVEYPLQNKIIFEKFKETNKEKYGVEFTFQSKEIRAKAMQTLYKNGNIPTSSQQFAIYEMLKEKGYKVELNYPVSTVALDVAIFIDEIKIDIEYDGWYFHQDAQIDRRRDEFLKLEGWKVFRIKSRRMTPSIEDLELNLTKLINTDRKFTVLTLSDWDGKEEDK